jgi:hypothetical protein
MYPAHPQPKERDMSTRELIDELDRCKTALQVVAEMQSDSMAILLEILLECLDDAIGQVQAHLQQCTCQVLPCDSDDTPVPLRRGTLTMYKRPKHVLSED